MRRCISELRSLVEGADDEIYVQDDLGMARLIALSTPNVTPADSPYVAADKAIQHLRLLSRRRSLLAKSFVYMRHRGRALQTALALRRKVESGV